jgi:hypothetical protein
MLTGALHETDKDAHVTVRKKLLTNTELTDGNIPYIQAKNCCNLFDLYTTAYQTIKTFGVALINFDQSLTNKQFISFGNYFGHPISEEASATQRYVDENIILNLISEQGHTSNVDTQPFSTNYLTLHTESSARKIAEQPDYIILMCCEKGFGTIEQKTVLVSIESVINQLTENEIALLSKTKYFCNLEGPTIIRKENGRFIISFRDFYPGAIEWIYFGDETNVHAINSAMSSLLYAMYNSNSAMGISWKNGNVVIVGNTYFFHGRTAGTVEKIPPYRHLKRLRIIASEISETS